MYSGIDTSSHENLFAPGRPRKDDPKATESLAAAGVKGQRIRHLRTASSSAASDVSDGSEFAPPKVPNPFYFRIHLTAADRIKVALMTVLVFPVRVFLVSIFLFLTWLGCFVGLLGYSEQELESKPIQGWRRKYWHPFFAGVMRQMFVWGGLVWEFKGQKAPRSQAPLLVCGPHHSFLDGVIVLLSGGQAPCTKVESKSIPLLGTILRFIQPVFVKRSSKESRQTTLSEIKNRATSQESWSQIVIFPEGTCSNGSVLLKFKQGAFSAGVPVQPVLIRYPNRLNTLTWTWDGPSALKTMWLTTCQWRTRMIIEYLPVYRPSEAERRDPGLFAYNVRQLMATALGIGTTEFGYDDLRFLDTGDIRQPHHTLAIVKLLKFRAKNGLTPEQLPLDIEKVSSLIADAEAGGRPARLSRSDVLSAFGVPPSEVAKEVFDALDMEEDVYKVRAHPEDSGPDQKAAQDDQVDLRTLLAALHLSNRDGDSAFKCLSGESVVTPNTTTLDTTTTSPSITTTTAATNGIVADNNDNPVVRGHDAVNSGGQPPATAHILTQVAFCRLCWLAMQMPRRDAEQLFEHFRSSPLTLPAFRELLAKHTDRCKGIVYFGSARRLELGDVADQVPLVESAKNKHIDGDHVPIKDERKSFAKKMFARKVDSNGSNNSDKITTITTTSPAAAVTSQSKRQKAE